MSTGRMSKRLQEPVDQWLAKEGYFRKPTPRDPNCLFRSVSEQIYHTQHYHLQVRKECTEFMKREKHLFTNSIMTSFDYYIEEMECFTEWGGPNEIRAMSLLYNRDIIIFIADKKICENVTNNYKEGVILLCHTESKQYEPVYPMAFVQSAAYCQSIVYEVLYKYMYNMPNVKTVADKMLHNRNATLRHDKFFQKGNLDIRGQLVEDLYKKVKNGHGDTADEAQSEWKGTPPIPYKVAKALAPDYYRNIELDIWHELKREVKSAGWNRYNSNELQVGGKCLIEISVNDLQRCERNKKFCVNLPDFDANEGEHKIEQQKLKQGHLWLQGYIQDMKSSKEPVLVFIKDLGEKKFVPYDALKPLPNPKKNRQKNWALNRSHSMNSDSSRRWRKSYNFTRKRKDTLSMTNGTTNTNKNVSINDDVDIDNNNDISKISFENDGYNNEISKTNNYRIEDHSAEDCADCMINEKAVNQAAEVTSDNLQSTVLNNVMQETVEEHKKTDAAFKRMNSTARNKTEKSNNYDNSFQNSCSKPKISDENYPVPYNGKSQVNTNGNPNMSYAMPDNNYAFYPYMPGNFGEHNQMDHTFASNFFYNLHLLHLEDTFRILNPTYYGTVAYGPGQHSMQPLGVPSNANNIPYMPEEVDRIVNGMQNCSLTYNEGASNEIPNTSYSNNTSVPNARLPKQGSKNLNGKDSSCQASQKGKQTATAKGNRTRNRQHNVRLSAYAQHSNNNCTAILNTSGNTCDTRRYDALAQQSPQQHWDVMLHQMTPMMTNAYAAPQYAPPNMLPAVPYHELPSHCANENGLGNLPYYLGNGSYMPMPYLPTQHVDAVENAAIAPYPQHLYPAETYSSYPPNPGQLMPTYPPPLMYHQSMQYPAMLPPPQPLPPPSHMQEQWNPTLQPYMQCPASQAIVDSSSNGQGAIPNGSL
ncbi:uncharacterized protein [Linepithema humile]|uniref:uncharacterized protein isoform X2 n=1 Tax=Linepithema humile TaxID=83485 RepID=UPI0006231CA9|nr:PREDICTED: uncharacterized protein LOC105671398 isoform X1 [Linepithema humile]XP_012220949.1 PREDICTED: uncharacterized protein LOC105671398 isoform X1 [Linepithema humile]XP_012220950.1 PREDICTED: uncharacterized protein LOC105671398 isoform X1 [Linepithema humile]